MRAQKKSYIIRIPVDAAEIPVLFGRGSARRSISAILTTTVTTTTIHALVRPDSGNRDRRTRSHAKPPRRKGRQTRNPEHLAPQNQPELPNVEREPRTVHLMRALGSPSRFTELPVSPSYLCVLAALREILSAFSVSFARPLIFVPTHGRMSSNIQDWRHSKPQQSGSKYFDP